MQAIIVENIKRRFKIAGLSIIIILLILVLISIMASYKVLIHDTNSTFYKAKTIFISGNLLICLKESQTYTNRKAALAGVNTSYSLRVISMKNVAIIEILHDPEEKEPVTGNSIPEKYLGKYTINAAGNYGFLYISAKGNYTYGTIRFPNWAKGSFEQLKSIRINDDKIEFTRSVTTKDELKKVGSTFYFSQKYVGQYKSDGKIIQGIYYVNSNRRNWQAFKIK